MGHMIGLKSFFLSTASTPQIKQEAFLWTFLLLLCGGNFVINGIFHFYRKWSFVENILWGSSRPPLVHLAHRWHTNEDTAPHTHTIHYLPPPHLLSSYSCQHVDIQFQKQHHPQLKLFTLYSLLPPVGESCWRKWGQGLSYIRRRWMGQCETCISQEEDGEMRWAILRWNFNE
jgi:hypothetical protein